ncbi:acetyltransferase [Shewanella woodyi]|uniref:acetyltransferase n=1 Tax=Shewanella woodyi TaxID=60961 RepID=UPI0007E9805B|nr:acetyltransferase [Shewanella woodyi]
MSKPCVIVGCGAHASAVISIIEASNEQYKIIGLADTANSFDPNEKKSGYSVISTLNELLSSPEKYINFNYVLAIGNSDERALVFDRLAQRHFLMPNVISRHAIIDRTVKLGVGNIIGHCCIINSNVTLGDNNLINSGAIIEHHCSIGKHTHIAPKALLCGGVQVFDSVFIGAGATITPNLTIEANSIIGAGSLLLNSISDRKLTYIGVPAKVKI